MISWIETAASAPAKSSVVEPPWKKRKLPNPSPPPSFLSLPDVLIQNCLARVSKSYYPNLSLVSKTIRSLVLSLDLNHARFHHKTQEAFFHVCLQFPDRPLPSWFTLWIKPDQIDDNEKKKKSILVQVPSSYANQEPLFVVTVGSEIYALRQQHLPSHVMLVRNKECAFWRKAPKITVPRANPAACVLDGKIYVMGGSTAENCWGEVFDTKTQKWEALPDPGAELRFSSIIRKIENIQGKIYVRSNEKNDSVYDPKLGKWNVTPKALVGESRCMIGNLYYSCRAKTCLWYDTVSNEWKPVKGLSSLNRTCRRGLIETVCYGGKLLILWDKFAKARRSCKEKSICCALVALERRKNGQVWGKVEWSSVVLTLPSSYAFLRSSLILV
ncbi:unnamed protein product [Microthlaspi erraticum]|uniref:F-box domain-containing protein n=1 Tax=Microthlaspi erraticum TaxID=1685480 RepID=A0A6D2I5R4_9BRAS|nr:unnamed protein product [Microthlaspi erraticum]